MLSSHHTCHPRPWFPLPSPESVRCPHSERFPLGQEGKEDSSKWVTKLPYPACFAEGFICFSCLLSSFPAPPFLWDSPVCVLEPDCADTPRMLSPSHSFSLTFLLYVTGPMTVLFYRASRTPKKHLPGSFFPGKRAKG